MSKTKVINDPVYGFIEIPGDLIFHIIEHPFFQRLRRIRQLGLTENVYPGAIHTRFHHALGAMHLMNLTLNRLQDKGVEISKDEFESALVAILLHDIGHGPFSHSLEYMLLGESGHEKISSLFLARFNSEFGGALDLAQEIFDNKYSRPFFNQLVSSQLDMDRLDYLTRDSFHTGVLEGTIGAHRIINLLEVVNDQIVIQKKGIYSIENFLSARRLMYWQVYLHKTTISSEKMLIQIIRRARELIQSGNPIVTTPPLKYLLSLNLTSEQLGENDKYLEAYAQIDDFDVIGSLKFWSQETDRVLSELCGMLLNRKLFRTELLDNRIDQKQLSSLGFKIKDRFKLSVEELEYYLISGSITNAAYISKDQSINTVNVEGQIVDIASVTDFPNIKAMSKIVRKYYLCWPKSVSL